MREGWQAFVRGLRLWIGLAVEPVDYSPEAQLARLESRLRAAEEDR